MKSEPHTKTSDEIEVIKKSVVTLEEVSAPSTSTIPLDQTEFVEYENEKKALHETILAKIEQTEAILADLKLQKLLAEADFPSLVNAFCKFSPDQVEISATAKAQLEDYVLFYLLYPLKQGNLQKTSNERVWQAKHFLIRYQLKQTHLTLEIKIPVTDARFDSDYLPLFDLDLENMHVDVYEKEVMTLIHLWHSKKIFSRSQLSLINYDLNRLIANFKDLKFEVKENFLDNTLVLERQVTSPVTLSPMILDQIFIVLMDNPQYDLHKLGTQHYQIILDHGQTIEIQQSEDQLTLALDSNNRKRSILDFFTHYPFLVPLLIL
ncbi:hypothetical protein [uncultured Enterococcus sp.]|uniref:hypothetical protein n=1 Tax=uncultured Enterococcus sp. TaxID=167972 RepID=UPI0025D3969A|nr:hypothetical protein [uncultured Enterococcus sp.]